MWGETCRWATILSDAVFVSVVYITVKTRGYNGYHNLWRGNGTTLRKFASCCTSPSFVFGAKFATRRMALGTAHALRACRVRCSPKGPKLGFEYLPTYKNLHYVRTACTAFPRCTGCHGQS